jgi:hypothetical protein
VIICPCCGFRFEGDLRKGCEGCGARSVGEPLPKPEHELPAYGRPLLLAVMGTAMVLGFLTQTIFALAKNVPFSFGFSDWIAAGETAAWRLKWISIPISFVVLWGGRRIYRSMMLTPARFVGLKVARRGLLTSAFVSLLILTLIGVTVPARLRQRQMSLEAATKAQLYTIARAQLEYSALHGMIAPDFMNDLKTLPDPGGSIAAALANLDQADYKTHGADVAVVKPKQRTLSGAVLRNAAESAANEDPPVGGLSTNYELRLPGADRVLDTDDDVILRDGVILTVADAKETSKPASASAIRSRKP